VRDGKCLKSLRVEEANWLPVAYQTFIDLLTNHSKSVNSAFLQTYSALSDAPDPYPLLEASVDSMLVSEDTLPKLTEENDHLQKTVTKLTTQLEDTESRLQTERNSRKKIEETLESRVKEVEESWIGVLDEKKDNWVAKEKLLEDKVESQDRLISELKASNEVNQRLGRKDNSDRENQSSHLVSAEIEMLHSDLERTSARLAEVEARNEQLRLDLAQAKSQVPTQTTKSLEDDPGYMRIRSENSSLIRKLDASRVEKDSLKREMSTKLRGLEREVTLLTEERDTLKTKVQKWSDYEDIKQELEVLKSIEFSTGDDDELRQIVDENGSAPKGDGDTLEKLLLARNKKLSDELTILRVSHQDLQTRLQDLQEELSRTKAELEKAQNLNERLEEDMANLQAEAPNAFPSGASVAGTYVSRYAPSIAPGRKGRISPTSSIISGIDPRTSSGEPIGGGSGILPMITAQRDRFKKRNAQLEQELSESHRTVSVLRQEISALQKDNLNLYEKTRYVSTYNRGGPSTSSSSAYSSNPNPSTVSIGGTGNPGIALDRYRKAYESNISPFAAFRGRESARAYKRMSFPERMVYSVTRMVLASRTSRNLFAVYCIALHLLVFFSLYWLGTTDAESHASNLGKSVLTAGAAGIGGAGDTHRGDWQEEGFNGN
jgi:homeobox protein cut-like